jgi:hypothetical protein
MANEALRLGGSMRFFASWWERFPKTRAAPLVAVVVAVSMAVQMAGLFHMAAHPTGFGWA